MSRVGQRNEARCAAIGGLVLAVVAVSASAAVMADRYGAVYYPGETATFLSDDAGAWRVTDWQGVERIGGPAGGAVVAISHAMLDNRFGAFRLSVGTNETWFAFLRTKNVKPCAWVGVGTHPEHGWGRQDYRYLDLLAAAGVGVVRDDVRWPLYEKRIGEYFFGANLRGLIDGLHRRGIRFHPILNTRNPLYENPLDPDAYAKFATAFVKEFKVSSCDIFNEPHNFNFSTVYLPKGEKLEKWKDNPASPWIAKHAEVTRRTVDAIRAVDPTFSPGVGVEDVWKLFKVMLKGDLARPGDLISVHPYDHKHYPPEGNWLFKDNCREVREFLLAHGGATRIAITECGWTTYEAGSDATHAFVGCYPPCSLVQQAQYLIRFWILSRQLGIEFACAYDFMDDGLRRNHTEDNFGLVRQDGTPKPSFTALAAMTRLVGDAEPLGSKSRDESLYRHYDFRKGDLIIAVVWSMKESCEIDGIGNRDFTTVRCLDLQGNEIAVPVKSGRLKLTEIPVYLVFSGQTGKK